jgi:hypothetical protein
VSSEIFGGRSEGFSRSLSREIFGGENRGFWEYVSRRIFSGLISAKVGFCGYCVKRKVSGEDTKKTP